jgi:hypothetical protein
MRSAKTVMLCWNPDSDQVALIDLADPYNLSKEYSRKTFAYFSGFRKCSFEKRKAQLFIEAMHLIIRDGCSPEAVHKALLELEEYRDGLACDMPGNV